MMRWGERAERTWNGRWGKDSDVWTWELKRELGVVSPSGVKMNDDMSADAAREGVNTSY